MQERLLSVSFTWILKSIPLKNSLLYDTRYSKFHRGYKRGKYSYLHANFCDRETVWREMPNFNSILDFYCHQLQKLQLCFQCLDRSHLLGDDKGDNFLSVFWVLSQVRRSWGKNRRYRGNPGCGSKWDRDWSTKHQWHSNQAGFGTQFWILWFPDELWVWHCSCRNGGCRLGASVLNFHRWLTLRCVGWSCEFCGREPNHRCACLGLRNECSMCKSFNLWVLWHHNL